MCWGVGSTGPLLLNSRKPASSRAAKACPWLGHTQDSRALRSLRKAFGSQIYLQEDLLSGHLYRAACSGRAPHWV